MSMLLNASAGSQPPSAPPQGSRPALWLYLGLILLGFAALCVWVASHVPPGVPPDERFHLAYVTHLAETGEWRADIRHLPLGSEAHQPPLYYACAALVWRVSGGSLVATRLLSALFGLIALVLTFRLGREAFPRLPGVALAAAGVVAFLPMNLYLSSVCNNDELATLLVTCGFLALVRATCRGMSWRWALGLGLLCGSALLAKTTALCLLVGVVAALACLPAPRRHRLVWALWVVLGVLAIAGPWLLRNVLLYGDPLAGRAIVAMSPTFRESWLDSSVWHRLWLAFRPYYLWRSFWGVFSGMAFQHDFLPAWTYAVATAWLLAALIGLGRGAQQMWRSPVARVFGTAFLAGGLTLLAGYASLNLLVYQAQGRYFFALLGPLALVLCAGLYYLGGPRWGRWLPGAFVLYLAGLATYAALGPMV